MAKPVASSASASDGAPSSESESPVVSNAPVLPSCKLSYDIPDWITHANAKAPETRLSIFSVDIHPDGKRFVTAGGDCLIKVWSIESVATTGPNPAVTPTPKNDPLLATLGNHSSAVNTVRWSPDGRYLASGADDTLTMVWHLVPGQQASTPFGAVKVNNQEDWNLCVTFKGHSMDVQDVAWSPDSTKLATCSIDNKILVWQVDKDRTGVRVEHVPIVHLDGHNGWVKGLTWDPVGRYLASTSDDKSVIFWRCSDWKQEARLSNPYKESSDTTYARQISWSPDGAHVCTTHAYEQPRNVAYLVQRRQWLDEVDSLRLVGHAKPVYLCRFSPCIYRETPTSEKVTTICAIAGMDEVITVWVAGMSSPLVVLRGLFKAGSLVTDLAWSRDGRTLMACSMDGTLASMQFDNMDLGVPLTSAETATFLQKHYGDISQESLSSSLVETPLQMQMEQRQQRRTGPASSISVTSTATTSSQPTPAATTATAISTTTRQQPTVLAVQSETRATDGRRRISPSLLSNTPPSIGTGTAPVNMLEARTTKRQRIMPDNVAAVPGVGVGANIGASNGGALRNVIVPNVSSALPVSVANDPAVLEAAACPFTHSIVVSRDVMTMSMLEVVHGEPNAEIESVRVATVSRVTDGKIEFSYQCLGQVTSMCGNQTFSALVINYSQIHLLGKEGQPLLPPIEMGSPIAALFASENRAPFLMAVSCNAHMWMWNIEALHATVTNAAVQPLWMCAAPVRLDEVTEGRMVQMHVTREGVPVVLIAQRARKAGGNEMSKGFTSDTGVNGATGPGLGDDGSGVVKVVRTGGVKEECAAFSYHLGMRVWLRVADPNTFLRSDFKNSLGMDYISSDSTMSVLQATMNDAERRLRLKGRNALKASALFRTAPTGGDSSSSMALPGSSNELETRPRPGRLQAQRNETLAHLQTQLATALALKSKSEYFGWLRAYVTRLADDGDASRLRTICSEFLGPEDHKGTGSLSPVDALSLLAANDLMSARTALVSGDDLLFDTTLVQQQSSSSTSASTTTSNYWCPTVFGIPKRQVLRTVILPAMSTNRSLQRMVAEFSEIVTRVQERDAKSASTVTSVSEKKTTSPTACSSAYRENPNYRSKTKMAAATAGTAVSTSFPNQYGTDTRKTGNQKQKSKIPGGNRSGKKATMNGKRRQEEEQEQEENEEEEEEGEEVVDLVEDASPVVRTRGLRASAGNKSKIDELERRMTRRK